MRLLLTTMNILFISALAIAQLSDYSLNENIGLSPTAFNLQAGEKRITNTNIFLNNFSIGLKDNFSVSAEAALSKLSNVQFLARAKYTFKVSKIIRMAVSPYVSLVRNEHDDDDDAYVSNIAGIITIGDRVNFINFSYSRSFNPELTGYSSDYSVGVCLKFRGRGSFVFEHHRLVGSENYHGILLIPDREKYSTFKARWPIKKRHQVEAGFFTGEFCAQYHESILIVDTFNYPFHLLPGYPVISYSFFWGSTNVKNKKPAKNSL